MRTKRATNRLPAFVLGAIVLMAIVARIVSPPPAPVPGPRGIAPGWKSTRADGQMGPWAVNPSATKWAGAWNNTTKGGKAQSAVWIIDFAKGEAKNYVPKTGAPVADLSWTNDNTIGVTLTNNQPNDVVFVDAATGKMVNSGKVAAAQSGPSVVVSPDKMSYSYKAAANDTPKLAFTSEQIPGRMEGMWTSPAGILVLCRNADTFTELVYDAKAAKLNQVGKDGFVTDVKTNWPDAPKEMLFVTFRGGFSYDLASAKSKQIFDYSTLGINDDAWRQEVQEGRLYPRKDGGYTSVSSSAGTIDIRVLDNKGILDHDILPRR